ncbi:MAG: tetratricopeptide repeat protein [Verrucomicrobiae bacterium]|nr:tetratricopeptide repeat protein [Verrucomicrobiae bacterium]
MNRPVCLLLMLLMAGSLSLRAQSPEQRFAAANSDFAYGRYPEAIRGYESLIGSKSLSAPVFFNLANAYFRNGQIGKAIVNYKRALLLAPRDPDLRANLGFTLKNKGLYDSDDGVLDAFARLLPTPWWSLLGTAAVMSSCLLACFIFFKSGVALRLRWCLLPLLLLAALGFGTAWYSVRFYNEVVVTRPEAPLLISPYEKAAEVTRLTDGSILRSARRHGDFWLVSTTDGRRGWISAQDAESVGF